MTGSIVVELKNKLAELEGSIDRLRDELASAEDQRSAFIKVISAYDPTFVDETPRCPMQTGRPISRRRSPALLKRHDLRRGLLETLRDAEEPILVADLSKRYLQKNSLEESEEDIAPRLSARFAILLNKLLQDGLVSSVDAADRRRRLWEIAR